MSHTDADQAAATAVVAHHRELSSDLARHVAAVRDAAREGSNEQWREHRDTLLSWLRTELLPHAAAEEGALYPPAQAQEPGRLLVEGMLNEHRVIAGLVTELETADTAVDAAGAAHSLLVLFEVHLDKENSLVLPLLLASADVSLAAILHGMHDLLGSEH